MGKHLCRLCKYQGHYYRFVQGRVFIDRDPEHFGLILNFLRDGVCVLPVNAEARRQVLQEADFYQVHSCLSLWLTV